MTNKKRKRHTTRKRKRRTTKKPAAVEVLPAAGSLAHVPELPAIAEGENTGAALMRIIDNAVAGGQAIEVIERLLAVHERLEANDARRQYNVAVAELRAELPEIVKTELVDYPSKKAGGRVQYMHENLARMVEDLSPVMARHGLSFRWATDASDAQQIQVTCIVTHAAGHSEEATLFGPPDTSGNKNAIQAIASTVSYLQRYTLKAAVGIAAGHDDDGQGGAPARQNHAPIEQPRATGEQPPSGKGIVDSLELADLADVRTLWPANGSKTINNNQQGRLYNKARKVGWTNEGVDAELGLVLQIKPSEIPSTGNAYEAIVRWFQAHPPASSGGAA